MRRTSGKRLNSKITIKQTSQAKNAYHEMIDTWSTLATVWAYVQPLSGSEALEADKINAKSVVKFTIRARNDLGSEMHIVYSGRTYAIDYLPPYDPRREMEIIAHEVV